MKESRFVLMLSALILLSGCNTRFFKVISSSYAKEYCSCRFVVGQTKKYCHQYALQIVPVSSHAESENNKSIEAKALGYSSRAIFKSARLGCVLIN